MARISPVATTAPTVTVWDQPTNMPRPEAMPCVAHTRHSTRQSCQLAVSAFRVWDVHHHAAPSNIIKVTTSDRGHVRTVHRLMHSNNPVCSKNLGIIPCQPALRTSHPSRHIAPHGMDSYYVSPALRHYRCLQFSTPKQDHFALQDPTNCTQHIAKTQPFCRQIYHSKLQMKSTKLSK